jgi:hypothetical protein
MLTTSKSLSGSELNQGYYFNQNQLNRALRRKIKNTSHKNKKSKQATMRSQKHMWRERERERLEGYRSSSICQEQEEKNDDR